MPAIRARIFCVDPRPKKRGKVVVLRKLYLTGWDGDDLIVNTESGAALLWPSIADAEHAIKFFRPDQAAAFRAEAAIL